MSKRFIAMFSPAQMLMIDRALKHLQQTVDLPVEDQERAEATRKRLAEWSARRVSMSYPDPAHYQPNFKGLLVSRQVQDQEPFRLRVAVPFGQWREACQWAPGTELTGDEIDETADNAGIRMVEVDSDVAAMWLVTSIYGQLFAGHNVDHGFADVVKALQAALVNRYSRVPLLDPFWDGEPRHNPTNCEGVDCGAGA